MLLSVLSQDGPREGRPVDLESGEGGCLRRTVSWLCLKPMRRGITNGEQQGSAFCPEQAVPPSPALSSRTEGQVWSTAGGREGQEARASVQSGELPLAAPRSSQQSCVVSRRAAACPHGPT